MQAIVTDIIVNKGSETPQLQLSQNISNTNSSSISFADLLKPVKVESEKEVQTAKNTTETQDSVANDTVAAEKVDANSETVEKQDSKEVLAETKIEETTEKNADKISLIKENQPKTEENKNESVKLTKTEKSAKQIKKTEISESEKKESDKLVQDLDVLDSYLVKTGAFTNEETVMQVAENQVLENQLPETNLELNQLTEIKNPSDELVAVKIETKANVKDQKIKTVNFDKEGKIKVQDLRSEKEELIETSGKTQNKLNTTVNFDNENTATFTMDFANQNAQADILSLDNQTAAAEGSNFQAMLNNQIQQNTPEFVKAGNIILKDNDKGTINLVLHPDDLGNVKINLSMDGKTVTGHITVASKEAMEVFKDNAETLREAFIKSGFEGASFDVSYSGNSESNHQFEQQFDNSQFAGKRAYSTLAVNDVDGDAMWSENSSFNENFSEYSVNIVA